MQLGYVICYVPNVTDTVAFYERAFGLARRFVHESGQYAEMETGATALAFAGEEFVASQGRVFQRNRLAAAAAGIEIALVTEDVAGGFRRAVEAGATAVMEPVEKPWGQTMCYVRDLNGVLVEICSAIRR